MISTNGCLTNGSTASGKIRMFTGQELATYNRRDNAHVAVHGKVYDVSSFINQHPGGADQIALGAGRDISQVFESYHSDKGFEMLERFYVGDLISSEYPVFPPHGQFYRTLKQRVEKFFRENNIDPKYDPWMFVRYAIFLSFTLIFPLCMLRFHENILLSSLLSVLWGFDSALVAFTLTHDCSHFSFTHKPWVWRVFGTVHDLFLGVSFYFWVHQHIIGHHPFTNISGTDPDIHTHRHRPHFIRIKHNQPWIPKYIYQHIYGPLVYCFLGTLTRIQEFIFLKNGNSNTMPLTIPTYSQLIQFYVGKFLHINYRFTLFYFYMPLWKLLLLNLIGEIVASYWLALHIQVTHVSSEVEWPQPDADNMMNRDWAELQVATAQDYATDSWFWSVFTGSLNHQTAHHLFPGVIQSHYKHITPIVRDTCKEFGIKYQCVPTYWEALGCHFNHLKKLGQRENESKQD